MWVSGWDWWDQSDGRCKWVADLGRRSCCLGKVKKASVNFKGRNGGIKMGTEATRPTGDSEQQQRAEQKQERGA